MITNLVYNVVILNCYGNTICSGKSLAVQKMEIQQA